MSRFDDNQAAYKRIDEQAGAEFEFAHMMADLGLTGEAIRKFFNVSVHEYNVFIHFIYGVNDEEPNPRMVAALGEAMKGALNPLAPKTIYANLFATAARLAKVSRLEYADLMADMEASDNERAPDRESDKEPAASAR